MTLLRIQLLRQPGVEAADETVTAGIVGTKINIVGAGIARPFFWFSPRLPIGLTQNRMGTA